MAVERVRRIRQRLQYFICASDVLGRRRDRPQDREKRDVCMVEREVFQANLVVEYLVVDQWRQ